MSFYTIVYEKVKQIPYGKVATYGQIALLCGSPRASRAVGYALRCSPPTEDIPCHRVVNRLGGLAPSYTFGFADRQHLLLESEGITVGDNDTVDLKKYCWNGQTEGG